MDGPVNPDPVRPTTVVTVCPGGPLIIRGPVEFRDVHGVPIPHGPSAVAVCRCGRSSAMPFCDGTHKLVRSPVND